MLLCVGLNIGIRGVARVSRIQQSYVATLLTTLRGADDAGAHGRIRPVEAPDVPGVVVVVKDLVTVGHIARTSISSRLGNVVSQWAAHCTVLRSMPCLCISYSGLMSRRCLTARTTSSIT